MNKSNDNDEDEIMAELGLGAKKPLFLSQIHEPLFSRLDFTPKIH
jgi:hypothetical protein